MQVLTKIKNPTIEYKHLNALLFNTCFCSVPNKLDVLNFICANGGVVEISRLRDQNFFRNQTSAKCFLESHPQFFRFEQQQDGKCEVRAHMTAAVCDEYDAKKDDCSLPDHADCDKFHLCKHYVTGSCKFGTR